MLHLVYKQYLGGGQIVRRAANEIEVQGSKEFNGNGEPYMDDAYFSAANPDMKQHFAVPVTCLVATHANGNWRSVSGLLLAEQLDGHADECPCFVQKRVSMKPLCCSFWCRSCYSPTPLRSSVSKGFLVVMPASPMYTSNMPSVSSLLIL